ncbi:transposase [Robertkochia solimangrovi]|nr:transposase [Robertkochia solimangrovi]
MQLSAFAYNLKKYLKFIEKHSKSGAVSLQSIISQFKAVFKPYITPYNSLELG